MSVERMKSDLMQSWPESSARALAIHLLESIARMPSSERKMLTYRSLANAAGCPISDSGLHAAIAILSASDALDPRAMFVDSDGEEYDLNDEEFRQARDGYFIHPHSGNPVTDYKDRIFVYFVPSARLEAGN